MDSETSWLSKPSPRLEALLRELSSEKQSSTPEQRNVLILDPSFFAHRKALSSFFNSKLLKEYRIVIPTMIYESVRLKNYTMFISATISWEEIRREEAERIWVEIIDLAERVLKEITPCSKVLEEISPEQRSILLKIDRVLGVPERQFWERDPAIEMAREIIRTACVTSIILSVSQKAKKWYKILEGTVLKRAEQNKTLMKTKEESREAMKNAGWKGGVVIWIAKHVPISYLSDIIDVVMILFANGTYRCQFCGRSLWRLPRDIRFCPYCSNSLP